MSDKVSSEDTIVIKQEGAVDNDNADASLCSGVKQEFIEIELTPVDEPKCAQAIRTLAGAGSINVDQDVCIQNELKNTECVEDTSGGNIKQVTLPQVYKCDNCPRTFKRLGFLRTHFTRTHGTELHKSSVYLESQVPGVSTERQYECKVCKKMYHSKGTLRYHIAQCYGVRSADSKPQLYTCDFCQKTFTLKESYKYHMTCVHASESYKCDQCHKSFKCETYLNIHKKNVHWTDTIKCDICGKHMKGINLRHHMVHKHSGKQWLCKLCGETYKSEYYQRLHLKTVHGQQPVRKSELHGSQHSADAEFNIYSCDYCGKRFTNKHSIKYHIIRTHMGGSHQCNHCVKSFSCKQYLMRHKANMHTPLIVKCNVCGSSLKSTGLRYHMQRMHGDKQLQCLVCGETVKSKYCFQQHMNDHHGQPSSNSSFVSRNGQKIYPGQRTFTSLITKVYGPKCSECKVSLISEASLQRHLKSVHSKEKHEEYSQQSTESSESTHPTVSEVKAAAGASTQQHTVVVKKEAPADEELDLGPVVFQHIDCNFRPCKEEPLLD